MDDPLFQGHSARELARRWLPETGYQHAERVVQLLDQRPSGFGWYGHERARGAAWLHDVLRVGRDETGARITYSDLRREVMDPDGWVDMVVGAMEEQPVKDPMWVTVLVLFVDGLVHLREGTGEREAHLRSLQHLSQYLDRLNESTAVWLKNLLTEVA